MFNWAFLMQNFARSSGVHLVKSFCLGESREVRRVGRRLDQNSLFYRSYFWSSCLWLLAPHGLFERFKWSLIDIYSINFVHFGTTCFIYTTLLPTKWGHWWGQNWSKHEVLQNNNLGICNTPYTDLYFQTF